MWQWSNYDCPFGKLTLVASETELVGLYLPDRYPDLPAKPGSNNLLVLAKRQLQQYFARTRKKFTLPLKFTGTPFQIKVWQNLQKIPYGQTCSYSQLAQAIGKPQASRAVGGANNKNPIAIIVPCHRVIGQNGQLVGYGGGLAIKQWLLEFEQTPRNL
jgi:methylated-DNA-[protein]-cysteine S-methyltransferase